jgi:hypothetical protein
MEELRFLLILLVPIFIVLGTVIFRWLWNITMPDVFGLKAITFWQAFRILLLAGFLFGAGSVVRFSTGG